jgi:uncharacterized protein involved in type VI secretion and phage assembly
MAAFKLTRRRRPARGPARRARAGAAGGQEGRVGVVCFGCSSLIASALLPCLTGCVIEAASSKAARSSSIWPDISSETAPKMPEGFVDADARAEQQREQAARRRRARLQNHAHALAGRGANLLQQVGRDFDLRLTVALRLRKQRRVRRGATAHTAAVSVSARHPAAKRVKWRGFMNPLCSCRLGLVTFLGGEKNACQTSARTHRAVHVPFFVRTETAENRPRPSPRVRGFGSV